MLFGKSMLLKRHKIGYQKEAQKHFAKADELEGRAATNAPPATNTHTTTHTTVAENNKADKPSLPKQNQPLSANYFGSTLRRVLTTREGFQEFLQFWLGKRTGR